MVPKVSPSPTLKFLNLFVMSFESLTNLPPPPPTNYSKGLYPHVKKNCRQEKLPLCFSPRKFMIFEAINLVVDKREEVFSEQNLSPKTSVS